jgi:hypothetical protein
MGQAGIRVEIRSRPMPWARRLRTYHGGGTYARARSGRLARAIAALLFLAFAAPALAAGDAKLSSDQLDALITDIRTNIFRESPDKPGKPGISADDITPEMVKTLYGKPGVLTAIQRIFSSSEYSAINERIGHARETANLRIWAQIVDKFGIRIELNNAGKRNGAVSDMDNTLFTDADKLFDPETNKWITDPAEIHRFLIEEHGKLWENEFGVKPIDFDAMHFQGDGLMQDWRMSKRGLFQFVAQMESDIARLSAVDGAYFVPGAYKPQVYGRYLREAGTFVIEPHLDPEQVEKRVNIKGAPTGVLVRAEARTGKAGVSRLYGDVPFNIDRTGALGGVLGNFQYADKTGSRIKHAKYSNRWGDSLIKSFTNLEVDWRHLVLAGKDSIRQYHVNKLFDDLAKRGLIPPEIGDTKEVRRIMDLMARVELDKIIRGYKGKPRPGFWSDEWKAYVPQDINETETKLKYYAVEAEEIRKSLPPSTPPPSADQLADMAEKAFGNKARSVARMAGAVAAKRVFNDVFTREGFARQVHLHGLEAAERLVAERVKGLHAALAFQTDDRMIRNVVEAAPPEVRQMIDMIAELAAAQRKTVLERGSITADELKLSNRALIKLLDEISEQVRREIPDEFARRAIATHMRNQILRQPKSLGGRALASFKNQVTTYFNPLLPQGRKAFFIETGRNLWDIGTVDNVGRIIVFNMQGRNDLAIKEGVTAIASAVPIAKDIWAIANSLQSLQSGDPEFINRVWPLGEFTLLKAFTNMGGIPADFALIYGIGKIIYGIEKSLFDVGWHFYGAPTQAEVVSWVLMGHPMHGIYVDPYEDRKQGMFSGLLSKETRFPAVPPEAQALLAANAILKNKVKMPRFPAELKRKILRGSYQVRANKDTLAAGITTADPGAFKAARERYVREYFRKADYFLRRMYLYQAAHIDFFRYAQSFQKNFQMIDADPPTRYLGVPGKELRKAYPDAFIRSRAGGKGSWDHERIFLRDFFNKWLTEWKKTQLPARFRGVSGRTAEAGFFISTANNIAPWWEQAVVSELMNAFFEGEMWDVGRPEDQLKRHDQQRAAAGASAARGGDKMRRLFDKQVAEARKKAYQKIKMLEALRWHPELVDKFVNAVVQAAKSRAGDYKPKKPELRVKIPRPVARTGAKMVIEASVAGDAKTLPDDLELMVKYKKVKEHRKKRPKGVLRDDVRLLLGPKVKDKDLVVHEHRAEITLVSKSRPEFKLGPVTRTVYWLPGKPPKPLSKWMYVIVKIEGSGYNYDESWKRKDGQRYLAIDAARVTGAETRVLRVKRDEDPKQLVRDLHKKLQKPRCRKISKDPRLGFMADLVARGKKSKTTPMLWDKGAPRITILPVGPFTDDTINAARRSGEARTSMSYRLLQGSDTKWECPP